MKKLTQLLLLLLFLIPMAQVLAVEIVVLGLFTDMVIMKVDDNRRKLRTGETSPEGITLISANSERAILEINGKQSRYELGSHISARFDKRTKAQAQIWPKNGMYITAGSINKQPVQVMIDTGATWVAMNSNMARKLGINYRYEGTKSIAGTASGKVVTYVVTLKSVQIGDIKLRNVKGAVIDGNYPEIILLGNSFLNRVELQRKGQMMLLRKKF